jgi:hypothetical protein
LLGNVSVASTTGIVDGVAALVLEFKVGATTFDRSAIEQAHDYALDLKNFHRGSHSLSIVPIVVGTCAKPQGTQELQWASDMVAAPLLANADELQQIINHSIKGKRSTRGQSVATGPTQTG